MTVDGYNFEGGRIQKMEVDYSSTCDEKIPEAIKLAASGKDEHFRQAIDVLLQLEKQTRLVGLFQFTFTLNCFLNF